MKTQAIFYHAGCPVCMDAEKMVADAIDPERFNIEIVHLAEAKDRITEAEGKGVKSVPALVIGDGVFHINYGAGIGDLKA